MAAQAHASVEAQVGSPTDSRTARSSDFSFCESSQP